MSQDEARILPTLEAVTQNLMDNGVTAICLTGSWARGTAHAESDIDLLILGEGTPYRLERRDGLLISLSWLSFAQASETMRRPESACFTVPGWRDARVLYDPEGLAEHLKDEAEAWDWDQIESAAAPWVTEEITDYAEEVQKLVGLLEKDPNSLATASQRAILALRLAPVLAVHNRILYKTENDLWDQVGDSMGPEWKQSQRYALGLDEATPEARGTAALEIYAKAAHVLADQFDSRQRDVVAHACALAELPLPATP